MSSQLLVRGVIFSVAKVTVAIIAYYRQFLKECIESVLDQTYKDIKVIVYDDCSPEDLKSIVDSFEDERLYYFRNERNLRTFGNTNQAIELCDTEYINVFHGDDVMFPWMVEKLFNAMEANPNIVIATSKGKSADSRLLDIQHLHMKNEKKLALIYKKNEFIEELCKSGRYELTCPATFLRKKELDRSSMKYRLDVGSAADLYFFIESNNRGFNLCFLNEELFFWRRHDNTWSDLRSLQKASETLITVDNFIKSLNLDVRMDGWHLLCAKGVLAHAMLLCKPRTKEELVGILQIRKDLERNQQWCINEKDFNDLVSVCYLGEVVTQIGLGQATIASFRDKEKNLNKLGITISVARKLKWFFKYLIYQRYFKKWRLWGNY